jgi:hypothetical protein
MLPRSAPHRRRCCAMLDSDNARGPRDFGDRATNADRSGSTPLTGANSYPRRRKFGAGPPKAGCECSTHSVGATLPLKHIEMCSRLVSGRQLVQIQPSAPSFALQALKAERRIRNPEVDRAIRSWGTSHGSLTQRDRDPPFKRSDPGAIPGRPTNCPSRTESGAPAL